MDVEIERTLEEIARLARERLSAGVELGRVETKTGLDIVTERDLEMERALIDLIRRRHPGDAVYAEETAYARPDGGAVWVIDPIDGTVNFAAGLPLFNVSVGFEREEATCAAIVVAPALGARWTAASGEGAWRDGERLLVSRREARDAVIGSGFGSHFSPEEAARTLEISRRLASRLRGVRAIGSCGLELAWIAEGRLDGFVSVKADPFSTVAGALLVREAGGVATDLEGRPFGRGSKAIVASNGRIHDVLLAACR